MNSPEQGNSVGTAAYKEGMDTFDVVVTAWSNRDLKQQEFERQVAMIKPVMSWDQPA